VPGARNKFAASIFEPNIIWEEMYCIEQKTCDFVGTFRRPPVIQRLGIVPLLYALVWHFASNYPAVKFAETWMSNHLSELREHNYVSLGMYPESPTKDWWSKSCWLNPRESDPDVVQGPVGLTTSSTLLGPVLVWSQHNYQKCLLIVRYFKSS